MIDLLLIVPHPDDEVFGSGGLFARMAAQGKKVATLTLTRGGAGRSLGLVEAAALPERREQELRASLDALGVRDVFVWDYPDYVPDDTRGIPHRDGLQAIPPEDLVPKIATLTEELRPRAVLTFPPNGANGHPDHVATHRYTLSALETAQHRPERLYYFASEAPYSGESRRGFLAAEEIRALHLPTTHYVEVGPYVEAKLRAMGQHETQARSVLMFMRMFTRRLLHESFHRARPSVPPGEGARTVESL
jgi:N-acetylglucosamine malate deacetylase 2